MQRTLRSPFSFTTHRFRSGKYSMSTDWTSPTTVTQYAEDASHISWTENFSNIKSSTGRLVSTTAPLLHIARTPRNDITMKT